MSMSIKSKHTTKNTADVSDEPTAQTADTVPDQTVQPFDMYSYISYEERETVHERARKHMTQFVLSGNPKKDAKMYRIGLHAHMEMILALKDVKYLAGIRKPARRHFTEVYQVAEALLFTGDVNSRQKKYRKAATLYKAGIVHVFSHTPRSFVDNLL